MSDWSKCVGCGGDSDGDDRQGRAWCRGCWAEQRRRVANLVAALAELDPPPSSVPASPKRCVDSETKPRPVITARERGDGQ